MFEVSVVQDYMRLEVWQRSHRLALAVYRVTKLFPPSEAYNLTSQIRRSSVSIPSNIAEGCGRSSRSDMARFLSIALGSCCELQYQLLLSHDLEILNQKDYGALNQEVIGVKRMLSGLVGSLNVQRPLDSTHR
jgi:four helix bundle protein